MYAAHMKYDVMNVNRMILITYNIYTYVDRVIVLKSSQIFLTNIRLQPTYDCVSFNTIEVTAARSFRFNYIYIYIYVCVCVCVVLEKNGEDQLYEACEK
jgi:hypothetical protein